MSTMARWVVQWFTEDAAMVAALAIMLGPMKKVEECSCAKELA